MIALRYIAKWRPVACVNVIRCPSRSVTRTPRIGPRERRLARRALENGEVEPDRRQPDHEPDEVVLTAEDEPDGQERRDDEELDDPAGEPLQLARVRHGAILPVASDEWTRTGSTGSRRSSPKREPGVAVVTVAAVAGRDVPLDEDELRGEVRRALLVLAAGGDPERGLDVNGPAVATFAAELDSPERRGTLDAGLEQTRSGRARTRARQRARPRAARGPGDRVARLRVRRARGGAQLLR